jgi:hypothetical protein
VNVWSLTGQLLRTLDIYAGGHMDFGIDAFGNEVLFFIERKYEANDKIGQTWRLDGSMGSQTIDQFKDMIGWSFHISITNTRRPGWAIITSAGAPNPEAYNWAPMWNHIFAVKLDGSGQIAPIANLHHANAPMTVNEYNRNSFGASNRSMTAVIWGGTWDDADKAGPVHSYVARPKIP